MIANLPTYDDARKAIRGGKNPVAFLHLGLLYAQGLGVTQNYTLARYFLKKAFDMGCKEAEGYLELEYESGIKDFGDEVNAIIGDSDVVPQETIVKLKARIEKERTAGNIGNLAKLRQHLLQFYPEYNQEKAVSDILSNRHTLDADILFTLSTADNRSEIYLKSQDRLLQQLYSPITSDSQLYSAIIEAKCEGILGNDEKELAQCIDNITLSYKIICKKFGIKPQKIFTIDSSALYPYIKVSDLVLLRQQGFRALLSVRDIDPVIQEKFMKSLDSDEKLLNICEEIEDQDVQLFLIYFVELNIDIESLEITSLRLLQCYRRNRLALLVRHLNAFVDRLNKAGFKNQLPIYTPELLPPIDLTKES